MAKREEIRMIFSGGVMCENYHFFTTPRWSEKALFCTIFFSLNIDSDHRSVHLGWLIWVFWECMVKKMINFSAQWHIKEFYNSNFFEFWIFCFKSLLWLFGSVFHGSQGSLAKCEEMRMIFFWRCHVWKITIFSQPRGGQKRHYFAQFFFSEYRFVITGWCIWGGLFEFFEDLWWKNDKFFSTKYEEIRMIFFWKCHVWKITIFSQPRGGQKRHYFAQFFFSEYRFVITGWCIWGGLFEFFEDLWWKNDKFFSTMTY